MKDSYQPRGRGLAWATLLLPAMLASADNPLPGTAAAAPAAKSYVLFMGADIDVQINRQLGRVTNVEGEDLVVALDNRTIEVPMNRGVLNMKVTPQLKLSEQAAQVSSLQIERAYTPTNDPNVKWAAASAGTAAQSLVGTRAGQMASAMMGAQLADQRAGALGGGQASLNAGSAAPQVAAFNQATQEASSDMNNVGFAASQLLEELEKKLFDAALVTCEVSAARPVESPYMVVVAHYREKDNPNSGKSRIFAKALERLDENPVKVRILQGGFPPGYELVRANIHLYDGGREIGSNVADKNVSLTRDEAHEYLLMDHTAMNRGATLPPSVALGVNPWDLEPHYSPEQVREIIYVKVAKNGLPGGAFHDEKCSRPVMDAYLTDLLAQARFKPALQVGKPVEGVAKLRLADLAL